MAQTSASLRLQNFPHPITTAIHGKPTFTTLYKLKKEIMANAASVPSTLGGGQHGHLGLILTAPQYNNISLVPFLKPRDPGEPLLDGTMTWEQMQAVRLANRDARDQFDKVTTVETAIKQQIINSIEPPYLEEFRNNTTNTIEHPIHFIFETLFRKYGRITKQQLQERYRSLTEHNHNASIPPDTVFNLINEYEELAEHAGSNITNQQKVDIAYIIFLNTGKFNRALRKWNEKPQHDRTWQNFKLHLNDAFDINQEFEGATAAEAGFTQHANLIAEQVAMQLERREPIQQVEQQTTTSDNTQALLLQSINLLQEQFAQMQANMAQQGRNKRRGRNNNNNNNNNTTMPQNNVQPNQGFINNGTNYGTGQIFANQHAQNNSANYLPQQPAYRPPPGFSPQQVNPYPQTMLPFPGPPQYPVQAQVSQPSYSPTQAPQQFQAQNQRFRQKLPRAYCWTHGWCAHSSATCASPAPGHCPLATLDNRMGGSNKNCL